MLADPGEIQKALERDGIVVLPPLVSDSVLEEMRATFGARLRHMAWNNVAGYQRNERMRLMVEDVLTLSQGFLDIGLHPLVLEALDAYLGRCAYSLCEAKGWETLPTKKDFHGWHSDAWYDQKRFKGEIPREIKLAFYLSDVKSGAFQYVKGSQRKRAPFHLKPSEAAALPKKEMLELNGKAGTAILFDTSGIHRQSVPVLEPRRAVFYNYHDLSVPLQQEDVEYYRYHPLLLNAAFLGNLTPEKARILGFGQTGRLQLGHVHAPKHPLLHAALTRAQATQLWWDFQLGRAKNKLNRLFAG